MIKKIKVGFLSVFVLLLVGKRELTGLAESASDISKMPQPPTIFAQAAVMMDGENGRILYEKNAEKFLPMASTTKIMTCIVALEQADMNETVTVSEYAASMPDVQLNIRAGERYRMQDLLYSLMLESHNDSAVAIAEAVAGSEGAFAKMMNQKARDIGCSDTNFVTPNGLDSRNMETGEIHGTTAKDLAMIMRYCVRLSPKREMFLEITGAPSYTFSDLDRTRSFSCINHNALLTSMEGALSGKTGFTNGAGYCYVGAVKRNDKNFICALLGSGWPPNKTYKWQDMRKLITYGDGQFDNYKIELKPLDLNRIIVTNGTKDNVDIKMALSENNTAFPNYVLMREDENIMIKTAIRKQLQAPLPEGVAVGQAEYCLGDHVLACIPIVTAESVDQWSLEFCLKTLLKQFLFCYNTG